MRSLLDRAVDELTLSDLRAALAGAGDEDDRWEVKGGDIRPLHVFKAIAGLANRTGGLLLLGASRAADGSWELDGAPFPTEPGQWVARVIRSNLTPPPQYGIRVLEISPGKHAVVVRVDAHPNDLTVTTDGRVLHRDHDSTEPVTDGAELTRLVQARAGSGPAAALNPDASPGELGDAALAVIEAGQDAQLRSFISRLLGRMIRAAEFQPFDVLETETDRLSAVTSALLQAAPDSPVAALAIDAHHRACDAAAHMQILPTSRADLDLFGVVRRNARGLGALMVRLELWSSVRALVAHDVPGDGIYSGWMTYVAARAAKASNYVNAETIRHTVRDARETALRVPGLRPDGADEHQILDALLTFDLAANVIELDRAQRRERFGVVSPDFAVFAEKGVWPVAACILNDAVVRDALLPDRGQPDAARLLTSVNVQAQRVANSCASRWDGIADPRTMAQLQTMTAGAPA